MTRTLLPALVLALAPLAAAAQEAAPPPAPAPPPRVIQVTGEGRSSARPDLARLSLGVSHQAATAGEALGLMAAGVTAVLAALEEAGVAAADIQTSGLTLEAVYDYNASYQGPTPPLLGFAATQTLDVEMRDVAQVGAVLDAVVSDGANRLNGIGFDVDDPRAALDEARRAAVADARARAEVIAEAAGVTLGGLVSLSEGGPVASPLPLYDARLEAAAAPVPVAPGEVNLQAFVTATWTIADAAAE